MVNLNEFNITSLIEFPCHIFHKDKKGIFRECNDYLAKDAGFTKGSDLIGLTDFDLSWKNEAPVMRLHDQCVLTERKSLAVVEKGLVNEGTIKVSSYKMPLCCNGKIIGIFGIGFVYHRKDSLVGAINLTQRQMDCLYYLTTGMTAKEIAQRLTLSKRTVEDYIHTLKCKLKCNNKSELIQKALSYDFIRTKLFFTPLLSQIQFWCR